MPLRKSNRLSTAFTRDVEDREAFEQEFRNSNIPGVLKNILEEKLENTKMRRHDYRDPSWAYRQAHENGRAEVLEEIIEILTID